MTKRSALILTFTLFIVASAAFGSDGDGTDSGEDVWLLSRYRVTITNATVGQPLTPPVVITHTSNFRVFRVGEPAGDALRLLAEEGDTEGLEEMLAMSPYVADYAIGDGPFLPGESVSVEVNAIGAFNNLSVVGMLATTNDAFYGVSGVSPFDCLDHAPSRRVEVPAYDAGTEYNSEDCDYIPGPPCGSAGVRDSERAEGFVTIHSGIHGIGDLSPWSTDWRNPVVIITIEGAPPEGESGAR